MKIVLNGRFLLPGRLEGIGYHTLEIIKQLSTHFSQYQFVVLVDRPLTYDFGFSNNVLIEEIKPQARHPFLFYMWFQFGVKRFLKSVGADLFISFDGFCTLGAACPTVLCIHDVAFKHFPNHIGYLMHRYYEHFTPKFIEEAQQIVTVSEFSKSEIERFYELSKGKVVVSCNGVQDSWLQLSDQYKERPKDFFVVLGALQPRKNLTNVITAFIQFKKISNSNTKLKIVGRKAWGYNSVLKMAESSDYRNDIIFTGYLAESELVKCIEDAKALIYASLYEGFGVPIIEAMALGTAVITSNNSSMREVAGEAACLVNPMDVKQIAEALKEMDENPKLREELISKGFENARRYTWEKAAQPYIEFINSLR